MKRFILAGAATRRLLPVLLLVAVLLAGCSEDQPECNTADEGAISFVLTPSGEDPVITFTGEFRTEEFLFTEPPVIRYEFLRDPDGGTVRLEINDIGFSLPLEVGRTYTVSAEKGTVLERLLSSYALTIVDDQGVKALVVTDWEPNFSVLVGGYPVTGLEVFFSDPACPARIQNTELYRDITNRRLDFQLDGARSALFHGQSGALGPFDIRVFRAERVVAKANIAVINQIAFAMVRRD